MLPCLKQNKLEQSIINKNEATTILHVTWYRRLKILFCLNYAFFQSYGQNKQNVRVHGSVGKLSDGVKIKNRNHTYVLGLFSWSLTKISGDFSHVLITHSKRPDII